MQLKIQEGRDPNGDPKRLSEGSGTLCGHNLEGVRGRLRSAVEIEKKEWRGVTRERGQGVGLRVMVERELLDCKQ